VYYSRGENSWQESGVVANMPDYINGGRISNQFTQWYSY